MNRRSSLAAVLAAGALAGGAWSCGGSEAGIGPGDASTDGRASPGAITDGGVDASNATADGNPRGPQVGAEGGFECPTVPSGQPDASSDSAASASGVCPNGDVEGGCGDPQTDPHNCGGCGNDCMGGACSAGACVPLPANTLATGQRTPIALASDGQHVYWLNLGSVRSQSYGGGLPPILPVFDSQVLECDAAGCNNAPTVLATMPSPDVFVGGPPDAPSVLAVDSTNVYWSAPHAVLACGIGGCGCSPEVVVDGLVDPPGGVTAAAGRLFWGVYGMAFSFNGQVQTSPTGCVHVNTLADGQGGPLSLAADDRNVYWVGPGSILACAVEGCNDAPTVIWAASATDSDPINLTSDATNLYWTDGSGTVRQCAKADCAATQVTLFATPDDFWLGAIAVDATDVYWRDGNIFNSDDDNIYKCAIGGCNGAPTVVVHASTSIQWDATLAVDATRVYLAQTTGTQNDDRIMWIAK